MGFPQVRMLDLHACMLPSIPPPPVLPLPLPIAPPCMPTVIVGGMPAARLGDMVAAAPPHPIAKGSFTVIIGKKPAARVLDLCGCGGMITLGCFTVFVGG